MTLAISLLLFSAAVLVITIISSWLGSFIGLWSYRRLPPDAHWAERARLAYPARLASIGTAFIIAMIGAAGVFIITEKPISWAYIACLALCTLAGSRFVASRVSRRILGPETRLQNRMRWFVAQLTVAGSQLAVVIVSPILLPNTFNARAAVILLIALIVLVAGTCGGGLWVLRRLGMLMPASPHLATIGRSVAQRAGIDVRGVFELKASVANAIAFPILRWVIFTSRALDVLTDAQVSALFGHELAHLNEPRAVTILRVFTSIWIFFTIVLVRPVIGEFGGLGVLALWLCFLLVIIIPRRVMRRMEERADKAGKTYEEEQGTYAQALEKIYETNLIPAVMRTKRQIHPHLYDRMVAAGITPSFPRPAPPPRLPKFLSVATAGLTAALLYAPVFAFLKFR